MSNYQDMVRIPSGVHEALWQMFVGGPVHDGIGPPANALLQRDCAGRNAGC